MTETFVHYMELSPVSSSKTLDDTRNTDRSQSSHKFLTNQNTFYVDVISEVEYAATEKCLA